MEDQLTLSRYEVEIRSFVWKVYGWMTAGLAMTGFIAAYMASDPSLIVQLMTHRFLFYGLMFAQLGLVVYLSGWVHRMSATTASAAFLIYSGLTGVTLSTLFIAYTQASIASTFFITAATFGLTSVYGATTKSDLTKIGNLCFMALIGLILASLVNFFMHSSAIYWVTTYAGIVIFVGLTAYDTQRIKGLYLPSEEGTDLETGTAITGALALYLDFINLFIMHASPDRPPPLAVILTLSIAKGKNLAVT